jgi:putative ABC transport system substrate-binding protein
MYLFGSAAAWPIVTRAQVSTKRPLVAVLSATVKGNAPLAAFERGMRELGYVDGQNVDFEYRFANGR